VRSGRQSAKTLFGEEGNIFEANMTGENYILKAFNEFKKEGEPLLEEISKRKT
jgi:hypothetical protein